jgi:hypothetical protein
MVSNITRLDLRGFGGRVAALLAWLALTSACSESCRRSISAHVQSPDGAYVAEVEEEICDSGRRSRYVYLLKKAAGSGATAERVLVLDAGAKVKVSLRWKSDGSGGLTIGLERVPSGTQTIPKVTTILGVPITITDS